MVLTLENMNEELRSKQWDERIARMKREKERRERLNNNMKYYIGITVLFLIIIIPVSIWAGKAKKNADSSTNEITQSSSQDNELLTQISVSSGNADIDHDEDNVYEGAIPFIASIEKPVSNGNTKYIGSESIISKNAILVNDSTGEIVAWRDAEAIINPASMTKVLTVLVAAENVTDLDTKVTITLEDTDYAYVNDCSSVGFLDGERVTVRDLFYGTILPSGGDAAYALARYVAGSHEAFVEMMNQKLEELGIADTAHFTNCVGLYDKEHYCSVYDMAVIMKAALQNEWCKEVLSFHTYTTSSTEQHPEGITISNWFLRRIEDKDAHGEVLCAKTGFVNQSGSCAVSFNIGADGNNYICVTAGSSSSWRCIYDQVEIYGSYIKSIQN